MLATTILIALLVGYVVLYALHLQCGLWWAKVDKAPVRRLVAASVMLVLVQIILSVLFSLPASMILQGILWSVVGFAVLVAVSCTIIARFFAIDLARSLQVWLPTMASSFVALLVAIFVIRPFLFESFVSPTNAMAPTLLGVHWQSACPECGRPNYCSPIDPGFGDQDPPRMICGNFHIHQMSQVEQKGYPGDHFLVAKFIAPQRWDLVAFHYPENPATLYVMRLVGLPGETIHIEDGAVWADGDRLTLPENLNGIEYVSNIPDMHERLWAAPNRPAKLQADEFFVLGDFSTNAADSRTWFLGAPGHNSFAVPRSYIHGVVTHVYWPLDRWRAFH